MSGLSLPHIVLTYVAFVFSLVFHEFAHAWAATRLGDGRPAWEGRLTLDPRPHLDLVGSVIFPLVGLFAGGMLFGWARPVHFEPGRLRRPKRDVPLVFAAGPFSNLLLAFIATGIARFIPSGEAALLDSADQLAAAFRQVNIVLFVFNLVPVPPLDGSKILAHYLPYPAASRLMSIDPMFAFLGLIVLSRTGVLGIPMGATDLLLRFLWSL